MELEIECAARALLVGRGRWVLGQAQVVKACVTRATNIRVEKKRGFVMTGIASSVANGVEDFGAKNSGPVTAVK
jgi:hypothetical protein